MRRWLSRRRGPLTALTVALAIVVTVGALAVRRLDLAASHLRAARDGLEQAGEALEQGDLDGSRDLLAEASTDLEAATAALYNRPELDIVAWVPGIRQNVAQLRESLALASTLTVGGYRVLTAARPLEASDGSLQVPLSGGAIPLDAVEATHAEISLLVSSLPSSRNGDERPFLLSQVADLRDRVDSEVGRRRVQLNALASGLTLLSDMAGRNGDRRYVIAVANTAEMRGSGGMVLSYGTLVGRGGDFSLEEFGRIDEVRLPGPLPRSTVPEVPDDYLARWNGFDPLLRWRNATMSGDFTLTAPVLQAMYESATGLPVDGVIQIDPQGLAAILEGTGPVSVPEVGLVDADTVVPLVLNEAYFRFPGVEERSDVLADVAEATFRRLVDGEYDSLRPLGEALVRASAGRHIMMSSTSNSAQASLRDFGADGALPDLDAGDSVQLTVQNLSGNKLDYYLDTSLELTGDRQEAALGHLRAEVVISNTAPPLVTEPRYVFGPFNADQQPGLYRGLVTLYLPLGTSLAGSSGDPVRNPPVEQTEGGRPLVSWSVDVPAGQSRRLLLDLTLAPRPGGRYELVLVPSPRVRPTNVVLDIETGDGAVAGQAPLERTRRVSAGARLVPDP